MLFLNLNIIIIGAGWHMLFAVISTFQVSWIACVLLILTLIIAEHLIKMNFPNKSRKVCCRLIEAEYLDSSLSTFHNPCSLYFCHSSAGLVL